MERVRPENEKQVCELVNWALADGKSLSVHGAGSKRGFGFPIRTDCDVVMNAFNGIIDYEPSELVMTAKPGTSLTAVEDELARHRQQLAFEPPRLGALFGSDPAQETIGGAFLGNLSGPRRYTAGAARDHLLGIRAVNGRGIAWKSGGRVIKNVTGYDLSRLLAGSWGTLSLVTELTFKVTPVAERTLTLCIPEMPVAAGLALLRQVAGSPLVASGLAFLPQNVLSKFPALIGRAAQSLAVIRLEGSGSSVRERAQSMEKLLPPGSRHFELGHDESLALWKSIRDADPVKTANPDEVVIKVSLPPASAAGLAVLLSGYRSCRWYVDATGAWTWLAADIADSEKLLPAIRTYLVTGGGNAVIWRAPDSFKSTHGVHGCADTGLMSLNRRVKDSFDPANVFNPGRLFGDSPRL